MVCAIGKHSGGVSFGHGATSLVHSGPNTTESASQGTDRVPGQDAYEPGSETQAQIGQQVLHEMERYDRQNRVMAVSHTSTTKTQSITST